MQERNKQPYIYWTCASQEDSLDQLAGMVGYIYLLLICFQCYLIEKRLVVQQLAKKKGGPICKYIIHVLLLVALIFIPFTLTGHFVPFKILFSKFINQATNTSSVLLHCPKRSIMYLFLCFNKCHFEKKKPGHSFHFSKNQTAERDSDEKKTIGIVLYLLIQNFFRGETYFIKWQLPF